MTLSSTQLIDSFELMLLLRRFEEKCSQLYGMKLIGGFCHLYIGQEAIIASTSIAKKNQDSIITSYRCHTHSLISGVPPKNLLAELMGKATGSSKGKGGSMHIFNVNKKFYGGHGIVGAQVSIGTGIAFAEKYKKTDGICYCFLGDGATNQGQVYESLNMASLWNLPIIYIIENNQYGMGTAIKRVSAAKELYLIGENFGIPGRKADGMDLIDMYSTIKQATDEVRSGSGPQIIEAKTYRYKGHSMSDPATYRTKEELSDYKSQDPIVSVKKLILEKNYATAEDLKAIEKKVKQIIQEAVEFAKSSPAPDEKELYTDVYL